MNSLFLFDRTQTLSDWATLPDDVLAKVFRAYPPYCNVLNNLSSEEKKRRGEFQGVLRLVCKGWCTAAGGVAVTFWRLVTAVCF